MTCPPPLACGWLYNMCVRPPPPPPCHFMLSPQRPNNTRDPVSLAGRDTNYRNTPISWKGPNHEKCIVDKVMVTSEWGLVCEGAGEGGYGQVWSGRGIGGGWGGGGAHRVCSLGACGHAWAHSKRGGGGAA
jgi:hypothetical protein